ncbi:hypothetical protein RN001_012435 [Aquatica leii]|uniref:Uncharacterized protein n=1 Tax=Aquatica leii TaxID=1421715 RepID=A0AAN7SMG1_9COLE|nr:hypothetical protein RN001_012435 [Aquatica leii]
MKNPSKGDTISHSEYLEERIDPAVLQMFNDTYLTDYYWQEEQRFLKLYNLWQRIKDEAALESRSTMLPPDKEKDKNIEDDLAVLEPCSRISLPKEERVENTEEEFATLDTLRNMDVAEDVNNTEDVFVFDFPEFINTDETAVNNNNKKRINVLQEIVIQSAPEITNNDIRTLKKRSTTKKKTGKLKITKENTTNEKITETKTVEKDNTEEKPAAEETNKNTTEESTFKDNKTEKKTFAEENLVEKEATVENTAEEISAAKNTTGEKTIKGKITIEMPPEEQTSKDPSIDLNLKKSQPLRVRSFVVLRYDKKFYPAKIVNEDKANHEYYYCAMRKSGKKLEMAQSTRPSLVKARLFFFNMCEVTIKNFNKILPELKNNLKNAKFIAVDTEFSCLTASHDLQNSIFDSPQKRYAKLRKHVEQVIPVQIGLTAFTFDPDKNAYKGHVYTFYVFPKPFAFLDRKFLFQATSLLFLNAYKFDFNKFVSEGLSYLNEAQEQEVRNYLEKSLTGNSSSSIELDNITQSYIKSIYNWIGKAKLDETLLLSNEDIIKNNLDFTYFLHKQLRNHFKDLWSYNDENGFKVKKVSSEEYAALRKGSALEEELVSDLVGFTKVFRYIQSLQIPIIGHNLLLDLMLITHNFDNPLPNSYVSFKKTVHDRFPDIFDTKHISFEITKLISDDKGYSNKSLEELYIYFKDGIGRHVALNSPLIEPQNDNIGHFHCAGWDSFCTGYVFIRMAHIYASSKTQVKKKVFMSKELFQAVLGFKNKVNVIRGGVSYIRLDGDDPVSKRPPWLIVDGVKKERLDINEVSALLGTYGFVEVKPYSYKGNRAIVAVDNFGSAKRILKNFQSHSDFKIQQYNFLKHSPVANAFLWSGIIVSGTFLAWYGYLKMR